VTKTFSKAMFI